MQNVCQICEKIEKLNDRNIIILHNVVCIDTARKIKNT